MSSVRLSVSGVMMCVLMVTLPSTAPAQEGQGDTAAESGLQDGSRDFDFEFGSWRATLKRRLDPLTDSDEWVEYEGTSVVRPVWEGSANLGELNVEGPDGRIRGLTLRLYDPQARQWHIRWANARDGLMGEPMIGEFAAGRGVFYNQELFGGRAVLVRFVFSDVTESSFDFEQAFSDDGGESWEPNWVASFTRLQDD